MPEAAGVGVEAKTPRLELWSRKTVKAVDPPPLATVFTEERRTNEGKGTLLKRCVVAS